MTVEMVFYEMSQASSFGCTGQVKAGDGGWTRECEGESEAGDVSGA